MPYLSDRRRRVSIHTKRCVALILAGGVGSRLEPLTNERCKPGVSFGGKYRIIDFTLSNCFNSGIRSVGVITQYQSRKLWHHIQRTWGYLRGDFGDMVYHLPAERTRENPGWYLGTADAVYQNLHQLADEHYDYVLVLSGDHIYKMDYGEMLAEHIESGADITLGTIPVPLQHASRFGVVETTSDGRITHFVEKSDHPPAMPDNPGAALASMGIYVFSYKKLVELLIADHQRSDSGHDFGHDILPDACRQGHVRAYQFASNETGVQRYWRDVGTIDAYYDANMDLVQISPELNLYDTFWPIWTYQESAPPVKFTFDDSYHGVGRATDSLVSAGCMVLGAEVDLSILSFFVTVDQRSLVEKCLLLPHASVGKNCHLRWTIVDEGCVIPDGMQIGVDLQLDSKRFHVTESGLVVVTAEMLERLAQQQAA